MFCFLTSEKFWLFDSNSECTTDRINIRIDANHSNVECFYEMHNLVYFVQLWSALLGQVASIIMDIVEVSQAKLQK